MESVTLCNGMTSFPLVPIADCILWQEENFHFKYHQSIDVVLDFSNMLAFLCDSSLKLFRERERERERGRVRER